MVKRMFADMAQLVEHLVPIQEVAGSIPVVRSCPEHLTNPRSVDFLLLLVE